MSKMAKGTVRVQLTAAQVKVTVKALKFTKAASNFTDKEDRQSVIVVAKLK